MQETDFAANVFTNYSKHKADPYCPEPAFCNGVGSLRSSTSRDNHSVTLQLWLTCLLARATKKHYFHRCHICTFVYSMQFQKCSFCKWAFRERVHYPTTAPHIVSRTTGGREFQNTESYRNVAGVWWMNKDDYLWCHMIMFDVVVEVCCFSLWCRCETTMYIVVYICLSIFFRCGGVQV